MSTFHSASFKRQQLKFEIGRSLKVSKSAVSAPLISRFPDSLAVWREKGRVSPLRPLPRPKGGLLNRVSPQPIIRRPVARPAGPKRRRGQPPKASINTNDAQRALILYELVELLRVANSISRDRKIKFPLSQLIQLARQILPDQKLLGKPQYRNKLHASLKKGRGILGIDEHWRGPPLESLFNLD